MIFTHDVDFFSGTMPDPIHKSGGFSDFTPMTSMDTALIPQSQADSARREYVWIFQFEKGNLRSGELLCKAALSIFKNGNGFAGIESGRQNNRGCFQIRLRREPLIAIWKRKQLRA